MAIIYDDGSPCVLCKIPINDVTPEPEHVMLSGLGGRLEALRLICNVCNHELGNSIDRSFLESIDFIRNGLQIRSGHRGHPPQVRSTDPNATYYIQHDRRPHVRAQRHADEMEDGTLSIQYMTDLSEPLTTLNMLLNELRGRGVITNEKHTEYASLFADLGSDVRALGRVLELVKSENANIRLMDIDAGDGGYPEPTKVGFHFNNPEMRRALSKIIFEYFAIKVGKDVVLEDQFDLIRDFIRHGNPAGLNLVVFDSCDEKPFEKPTWRFPNLIWIFCDPDNHSVIGVFKLVGVFEFMTLFSQNWNGDKKCFFWATDISGPGYIENTYDDFNSISLEHFNVNRTDEYHLAFKSRVEGAMLDMSRKIAMLNLSEKLSEASEEIKNSLVDYNDREITEEEQMQIIRTVFEKLQAFIQSR